MFVVLNWPQLLPYLALAMMKLKFSFHLIWTFFVNISHTELSSWPKSAFSHLSASQVTSLASPSPSRIAPSEPEPLQICVFSGSGIFQQSRVTEHSSLSLRAPVLVTALSTHAHSRSSVSCQTRLRVSKLCRWPGSQRTLNCRPPLFCARCFTCAQNSWIKCWLKQTEKGNILMETWYWRSRLCWKSRSTQDFLLPGDN